VFAEGTSPCATIAAMKFDMKKMMAEVSRVQAQMQEKIAEAEAKLRETTVVGSAGGGIVEVEMNGQRELIRVAIKPEALASLTAELGEEGNIQEAAEELSDLVFAAVNSALAQATKLNEELMSEVSGGMNLAGLGLPNLPGL